MHEKNNYLSIADKRLLDKNEAVEYIGCGLTNGLLWLKEMGCIRKYGKRTFYDKKAIDSYLDSLTDDSNLKVSKK